jgi:adenine-specific DNA-methyltransferase
MDKDKVVEVITRLCTTFNENIDQYLQSGYKEAQLRKEFIDKFFISLGWDVNNDEMRTEKYKEVINEDAIKIGGSIKAPDYAFRIGGMRVFFVEAKKPSVNIKDDPEPAFQLKLYAWNSKIPISILTNFRYFAVYDCSMKPNLKDAASVGRLLLIEFQDYVAKIDSITDVFSKDAVLRGSFDRYAQAKKRATTEVDSVFLKEIEEWRAALSKNIALRNADLSVSELNFCVQQTINRILFLRICEDKNIETHEWLKNINQKGNVYGRLLEYFKHADEKYNSGIFDFVSDKISDQIKIDDKVLDEIISSLYYPHSSYDFSVLSVEILGSVYERFLGNTIRLTPSHQAKVEQKLEVRQAGGVYYTPDYVVDYIVRSTIGSLIEGKSLEQIEKIRILDPASGSGTFLVRAYSYLLDFYLAYYIKNPRKYKKEIYQVKENQWLLTTEVRKKILLNNIFGVDIDPQAVEITKLSLLLKVLENETKESVNQQLKLFQERALPNLDNNIKCGNSLVNSSFFSQSRLEPLDTQELSNINPFDWDNEKTGFGKIKKEGGFDIIIGNPPYVKEDVRREIFDWVKRTDMRKYYQKYMDIWYFFTCKSLDLLKPGGFHSFIAQNNWITSDGASILRDKILTEGKLVCFFDFNEFKVFRDASIQTMVFVLQKHSPNKPYMVAYHKVIDKNIPKDTLLEYLSLNKASQQIQSYPSEINPTKLVGKTIIFTNNKIALTLENIRKKGNFFLADQDIGNGIDVLQDFVTEKHLDALRDDSIHKGDGIFVLSHGEMKALAFTTRERTKIKPYYTSEELTRYHGNPQNNYWLIYADLDVRSKIDDYPNIKKHLDTFRKVLTSDFRPYGLHRPRELRFFEGEKILSLRKTKEVSFTYTDFPCYVSRAFLIIKPPTINLRYLTGLLNSRVVNFWLYHMGKKQGEQLQVDKTPLMELPIYKPDEDEKTLVAQGEIVEAVDMIIDIKKKMAETKLEGEMTLLERQVSGLERRIDNLVYKLYSLSDEDIQAIESFSPA